MPYETAADIKRDQAADRFDAMMQRAHAKELATGATDIEDFRDWMDDLAVTGRLGDFLEPDSEPVGFSNHERI